MRDKDRRRSRLASKQYTQAIGQHYRGQRMHEHKHKRILCSMTDSNGGVELENRESSDRLNQRNGYVKLSELRNLLHLHAPSRVHPSPPSCAVRVFSAIPTRPSPLSWSGPLELNLRFFDIFQVMQVSVRFEVPAPRLAPVTLVRATPLFSKTKTTPWPSPSLLSDKSAICGLQCPGTVVFSLPLYPQNL